MGIHEPIYPKEDWEQKQFKKKRKNKSKMMKNHEKARNKFTLER